MKTGIVLLVLLLWGCVHSGYHKPQTTTDRRQPTTTDKRQPTMLLWNCISDILFEETRLEIGFDFRCYTCECIFSEIEEFPGM